MRTHSDHGFLAGLDLPTEKNIRKIHKSTPLQKKKKSPTTTTRRVCAGARRADVRWVGEMSADRPPQTPGREGDALSLAPLFSEIYHTLRPRSSQTVSTDRQTHRAAFPASVLTPPPLANVTLTITNRSLTNHTCQSF